MVERHVKLFKNGRNQAVRIPREFELPGEDAIIRKDGERLIIEPAPPRSLVAVLAVLPTLDEEFPPIENSPAEPVRFVTMRFLLDTNIVSDLIEYDTRAAGLLLALRRSGNNMFVQASSWRPNCAMGPPTQALRG